jgi:hypothetical protein
MARLVSDGLLPLTSFTYWSPPLQPVVCGSHRSLASMAFAGRIYKDRTSTRGVTTIVEARVSVAVPAVGAITPSVRGIEVIEVLVVLQMQFV